MAKKKKKDLYNILEVDPTASSEEIKKAYRKKAMETHPDAGGTEEEFVKVNKAYLVLIDPGKRSEYDKKGFVDEDLDTLTKSAINFIQSYISFLIDTPEIIFKDLIQLTKNEAETKRKEGVALIKALVKKESHYKKLLGKVKNKGEHDFVEILLERKILECKNGILQIKNMDKVFKQACQLLQDYEFDFDIRSETSPEREMSFSFLIENHRR